MDITVPSRKTINTIISKQKHVGGKSKCQVLSEKKLNGTGAKFKHSS